jgi:hypothetical protein
MEPALAQSSLDSWAVIAGPRLVSPRRDATDHSGGQRRETTADILAIQDPADPADPVLLERPVHPEVSGQALA